MNKTRLGGSIRTIEGALGMGDGLVEEATRADNVRASAVR